MPGPESILLLHGFSNTGACWQPVLDAGVAERFPGALAPDLRGHGTRASARPADLAGVLADLSQEWPGDGTVVGYSQGGRIALHVALSAQLGPRVRSLVLIGASPGISDPVARAERRRADERLAEEFENLSIDAIAARWAQTPVLAGLSPVVAARAHADRLRNDPAGLAAALRGLGTGALPSLWGRLGELTVPVTLIAGERDRKFSALAREMARSLPDVRVVIVPGAGHQVHLEQPSAVAALL